MSVTNTLKQFRSDLERCGGKVHQLSKDFTGLLGISAFVYGRTHSNGRTSWVSSKPEHDLFLLESQVLRDEPLFLNTQEALPEGSYLWFSDREFPGSDTFNEERARRFGLDHGMAMVRHRKEYLEICFFSGLLSKQPLYNLFLNEKALFAAFMEHFTKQLDRRLLEVLEGGMSIADLKNCHQQPKNIPLPNRKALVAACGMQKLLELSTRERECLLLFREGYTYEGIGKKLYLSARTVEHYIESIKNKLTLETRPELYVVADKLKLL